MAKYKMGACRDCGEEKRLTNSRYTVCNLCYQRARRQSDPDTAYKYWLRDQGRGFVAHEVALRFIEAGIDSFGSQQVMCEIAGVQPRRIYAVRKGGGAEYGAIARIARELDVLAEFEALTMREVGVADWSDLGSFCGDGAPPKHSGCGSWFHAHYGGGLCEECYSREVLGCGPTEPRDVRLAVTR